LVAKKYLMEKRGAPLASDDVADHGKPPGTSQAPSFTDLGEIAEELAQCLGLGTARLRAAIDAVRDAISIAGPTAIAGALAEVAGLDRKKAARLIKLLIEIDGGER
jgi:hypothetical protein